jgi:hypothetical protein
MIQDTVSTYITPCEVKYDWMRTRAKMASGFSFTLAGASHELTCRDLAPKGRFAKQFNLETKTHIHNRVWGIVLHYVALVIEGCLMCMPNVRLKKYEKTSQIFTSWCDRRVATHWDRAADLQA